MGLVDSLRFLAEEYKDNFYEFERSGHTISVYCQDVGKETLKKLHASLSAIDV